MSGNDGEGVNIDYDYMTIYMYRGNGYLTLKQAQEKKDKDKDTPYSNVEIVKTEIPVREIINQISRRTKDDSDDIRRLSCEDMLND